MTCALNDIIAKLRQDILLLEGFKAPETGAPEIFIGPMASAFPNNRFPTGKLHEFLAPTMQKAAASVGFVAALSGTLMASGGDCLWISRDRHIFPPGLAAFGILPHRVVFCDIKKEKHLLWATEEALQCKGIAAVVAEVPDISYLNSLRLQLSIEESRVTGFLLRYTSKKTQPIASAARWRISPARSKSPIPGLTRVGYPRWLVQLEKVKNGRPGNWELEWSAGRFHVIVPDLPAVALKRPHRRTG